MKKQNMILFGTPDRINAIYIHKWEKRRGFLSGNT